MDMLRARHCKSKRAHIYMISKNHWFPINNKRRKQKMGDAEIRPRPTHILPILFWYQHGQQLQD